MPYGNKQTEGGYAASHPEPEPRQVFISPATGTEKNTIAEQLVVVGCWKISDLRFDFDSSFVLPDAKSEFTELDALRKAHAGAPISLFGHADPTGNDDYNKTLSGRRAEAVYAVLIRDTARWEKLYKNPFGGDQWSLRHSQIMATALGFDTGGATGVPSKQSTDAFKAYQRSKGLNDDGDPGPKTREKLFADYMTFLWPNAITKQDFLLKGVDAGGKGDYQGCSEFNPVMVFSKAENDEFQKPQNKAARDTENSVNRRVMALLFKPGTTIPMSEWPCPRASEGVAGCKARFFSDHADRRSNKAARREFATSFDTFACRFYQLRTLNSPCEGVVVPVDNPNTITLALDSPHFVPGEEELVLTYTITGPLSHVIKVEAVVTLFKDGTKEVARFPIPGPYAETGTMNWKGDQVTDAEMDTFLALKKSPYNVQLILTDNGGNKRESNKEKLEVLVHSIEIKVDIPAGLSLSAADKKAVETLKKAYDEGSFKRIVLDSTIFKIRSSEMNDDTFTDLYEAKWKNGPSIPFFAKILLKKKDGSGVRSVKVLKGAKVLWDMRLPTDDEEINTMDGRLVHQAAKDFITKVSAHKKDTSEPKGRTAPIDLRGMRGTQAERDSKSRVHWKVLDGAWPMTKAAKRVWDVHTECGTGKFADYDTAVFFFPGRMAGDKFFIKACVDHDAVFDTTDQAAFDAAPAERKSAHRFFTVFRRILIHKNYFYGAGTTPLDIGDLIEYFKAAVLFEAAPGMVAEDMTARWKTAYKKTITALGKNDPFMKAACEDDPDKWAVKFKTFEKYKEARTIGLALFGPGQSDYKAVCDDKASTIYLETAKEFPFTGDGMVLFRWNTFGAHNMVGNVATTGLAPSIDGYTDRTHGAFFVFQNGGVTQDFIHEVGHTVFLAHAIGHFNNPTNDENGVQPAGFQKNAHDKAEFCTMSYHDPRPSNLCGLCQLKLRGWDYMKINRDGVVS